MKKFILFLLTSLPGTRLSGVEFSPVTEGISGIYLCTRDLADLAGKNTLNKRTIVENAQEECSASFEAYRQDKYSFLPYASVIDGCHYTLRHCFLVHAVKLEETIVAGKRLLRLKYIESLGFTGLNTAPGAAAYPENIFRNDDYKKEIISCQVAFDERDVTVKDFERYEVSTPREVIYFKWAKVSSIMDIEISNGYNAVTHNCCTVAFRALESINPDVYRTIDPSQINFGIGVDFFNPQHVKWILANP
ncbi:MAG: hypothetical protein I8H75_04160 [Myxococcaceae bacterium]|nr:hypothetical protein [Myxococcaceae bacterium]